MCKAFRFSIVSIALIFSQPAPVLAADVETCNGYAAEATSAVVQGAMNNCCYSGDAWNADRIAHFDWCRGATAQAVQAERDRRRAAVEKCERCKLYAEDAVSAQSTNLNSKIIVGGGGGVAPPATSINRNAIGGGAAERLR